MLNLISFNVNKSTYHQLEFNGSSFFLIKATFFPTLEPSIPITISFSLTKYFSILSISPKKYLSISFYWADYEALYRLLEVDGSIAREPLPFFIDAVIKKEEIFGLG